MAKSETVRNAERLVEVMMKGNDASHDAAHAFRVRDLALSLAHEEEALSSPISLQIVCFFTSYDCIISFYDNIASFRSLIDI
ncbi:hypothetical protein HanLR1_Chr12g0442191 [Helianthus annuus]|nr:hypothetical protein HanLR1_Chr12g0442191 [Helianthus annuus]